MSEEQKESVVTDWQKEKAFLEQEQAAHPELFVRNIAIDDDVTLQGIGIDPAVLGSRIRGHVKLFPEDFIVEEVSQDGVLHTIDTAPFFSDSPVENGKTVWCDLVKMGIDTLEVVEELSRQLGIEKKYIGVAGIKDRRAITSQLVSIRGVRQDIVAAVSAQNFFLKNITTGKGALSVGALRGNRFTIVVRTKDPPEPHFFETKIHDLQEQGFWNFFYTQRFGTPRLISHKLGLFILQERYEEVVRM
ncbi:MAG: tRNA pseudouridine(13) synthase TruD, partial [Candidatus Sungiibacteriota bacterium]